MEELEERKVYLEGKLIELEANQSVTKVTEEDIRGLLTGFPECKNFIQDFVKEVVVYKTHVEVVFNVGFNFIKHDNCIEWKSKEARIGLYKFIFNA